MKNRKAIIVGLSSTKLKDYEKKFLLKNKTWGVILFSRNIKNWVTYGKIKWFIENWEIYRKLIYLLKIEFFIENLWFIENWVIY